MKKSSERNWDWLSACLLFALTQIVAARLVNTDWAPFLYFTQTLAALGTVLGMALGVSRFRRWTVAALATGYTAMLVPWRLIGAVTDESFWERLTHVSRILLVSLNQFFQRQPVKDPLLFVFFVCVVLWLISLAGGYWWTRHGSITGSIALGGAAIIIVQAYANYQSQGSWWLAIYLLAALLLAGRVHFLASRKDWSLRRVFISEESWSDTFGSLFLTAAIAVLLAWLIPTSPASLRYAADTWNTISRPIRERLSNAVTSLNAPYGRPIGNFYGSLLAVGQKAASGDSTVFTAEVLRAAKPALRYYWRGRAYDQYADGQWSSAPASVLQLQQEQGDLTIPDISGRSETLLQFTSEFPTQSLIYGPSPIVWLDRPATVVARETGANSYDALLWQARTVVSAGETYEVKAEIADPSAEQLRTAGTAYPVWIIDHYLGVPAAFRSELQTLAEAATSDQNNAYDKAVAITNYLRTNLQYSATVPAPPAGQDPVMWVLFEYKKGFCNYYASAEVLLLRSVGIPARLAVGFAQGEYRDGVYTVRSRDAHAWPEAYFPGIGWLEFEPTVIQQPLLRPGETAQTTGAPFVEPRERPVLGNQATAPTVVGLAVGSKRQPFAATALGRALFIIVVVVLALLVYLANRYRLLRGLPTYVQKTLASSGVSTPIWIRNWERWNQLEAVERAFASINWSLRWLGNPPTVDATPAERARALTRLMPSAARHIEALRSELESGLFTRQPADLGRARRASFFILAHGLRARFERLLSVLDGRDVYSS